MVVVVVVVVHTNIRVKPNCQLSVRVGVELSVGLGFDNLQIKDTASLLHVFVNESET